MPEFASLESAPVREHWENEPKGFTPWLAGTIEANTTSELETVLERELTVLEQEKRVGRYSVDILAEVTNTGAPVVIENQLSSSDHDHLGKAIAYASGVDADVIVWIAPHFHDEHKDAIQWLNENSREGVDLFAVKLEVWKIGESDPAVRLNPVEKPSEWKEKSQRSSGMSDVQRVREEFWTQLRDRIDADDTTPMKPQKPSSQNYYNMSIEPGFRLGFHAKAQPRELKASYIVLDNREVFARLENNRQYIESELDHSFEFSQEYSDEISIGRIVVSKEGGDIFADDSQWDDYLDWLMERGNEFFELHEKLAEDVYIDVGS
jgi:hypothetical protein